MSPAIFVVESRIDGDSVDFDRTTGLGDPVGPVVWLMIGARLEIVEVIGKEDGASVVASVEPVCESTLGVSRARIGLLRIAPD